MKQQKLGRCALALSLAVAGVGIVLADVGESSQSGTLAVLKDEIASPGTVRASKMIGSEVYDPMGKDVGKIKDIVLSRSQEKIDYAVVSHGTAGIDEKLLALPYKTLSFGVPSDERVHVAVSEDVLKNAPGFDESKWPSEANADYYRSLDTYYNTRLSRDLNEPETAQKASASVAASTELPWTRRATKLIGRDVLSSSGEKLGSIKDLVLDAKTGDVRYAVLAHGSGLEKSRYYAIPLSQFQTKADDKKLTLAISSADLKAIPSFDRDHWPASGDPRWTTAKSEMAK